MEILLNKICVNFLFLLSLVCAIDDPGVTLTYFTARSNLIILAFLLENGKTVDISESNLILFTSDSMLGKFLTKLYLQHRLLFSDHNL